MKEKCVLCNEEFEEYGHSAHPLVKGRDARCCNECHPKVLKERLRIASEHPKQTKL